MKLQNYIAEFTGIKSITPEIKRFFLKLKDTPNFNFKAGQAIVLELPIDAVKKRRLRSYSIASCPDGSPEIELVISYKRGGKGTHWLFHHVEPGVQIPLMGPIGKLILKQPIQKDIIFICTGTGIAPFRSMLLDIYTHGIPHKNITLVFGCRTQKDILYYDEMLALEQQHPEFHYYIALSRQKPAPNESHRFSEGYVHPLYEKLLENKPDADIYICGFKDMVLETRNRLLKIGYDRSNLHYEVW